MTESGAAPAPDHDALRMVQQSATENPRLEFRDGQFHLRVTNLTGAIIERFVSPAAVREAFASIPIDSGWLRPEIVRWGDGRAGEWAIAFFPPQIHQLEITNESAPEPERQLQKLSVPLPGLVLFGIGTRFFLWAVKTPALDPYQEIWRAPLPNVYTSGLICWGLVKPPRATARTLFEAWQLFITSTFNNHLASGKSKHAHDDVRLMLRTQPVTGSVLYPVNDLVRQVPRTGVSLDQALRTFFDSGAGVIPE